MSGCNSEEFFILFSVVGSFGLVFVFWILAVVLGGVKMGICACLEALIELFEDHLQALGFFQGFENLCRSEGGIVEFGTKGTFLALVEFGEEKGDGIGG